MQQLPVILATPVVATAVSPVASPVDPPVVRLGLKRVPASCRATPSTYCSPR